MRRTVPVFLLLAVGLPAGCGRSGNVSNPGTAPLPPALTVDQSATVTLTASESRSKTAVRLYIEVSTPANTQVSTAGKGPTHGAFEIVAVGLQAKSGTVTYDPHDFEVQGPDGVIYPASDGHSDAHTYAQITKGTLATGESITGNIVIDTTQAVAEHGLLLYQPGGRVLADWRY